MLKSLITLILILVGCINSFAEFDRSKLNYCSKSDSNKFREALKLESQDTHARNGGHFYLNFIFWIGFMDFKGSTHFCSLVDSTKEIQIRVIPDNESDSAVVIVLDSNGVINLAFIAKAPWTEFRTNPNPKALINYNLDRAKKLIYSDQRVFNATDSDIDIYKSEINFIGDYIGIIPGNKFKKYLLSIEDSIGRNVKKRLLNGDIHLKCDKGMMGKLVVKPIAINGSLKYEKIMTPLDANSRELKKSRLDDFVFITPSLNSSSISISRMHIFNKDSVVQISFENNNYSGECYYKVLFRNKSPLNHWVEQYYCNADGEVNSETSGVQYTDNSEARNDQKRVEQLIKHLK